MENTQDNSINTVQEPAEQWGFKHISEDETLLLNAEKTALEKLALFVESIKRNKMFNKFNSSIINH